MSYKVDIPTLPEDADQLEQEIEEWEQQEEPIKPGCRAGIVWADSKKKQKTEYALVYLHGFTASHGEGNPVHRKVADAQHFNLYLSRLAAHGRDDVDAFCQLTPQKLMDSAARALAVGLAIGKKVIVMGTSTGGSLGLYMAAQRPKLIKALILYSPLIDFLPWKSLLLKTTAGRAALRLIPGRSFLLSTVTRTARESKIWYKRYRLQGVLALGELVQLTMHKGTFNNVRCPVFTAYYFKSKELQDRIVSVKAIQRMVKELGTDPKKMHEMILPDASTHVISSGLLSNSVNKLTDKTNSFLRKSFINSYL